MARWEIFGQGEILTSLVRYLDHEDEQECELEMVMLEDARRGLNEDHIRTRNLILEGLGSRLQSGEITVQQFANILFPIEN